MCQRVWGPSNESSVFVRVCCLCRCVSLCVLTCAWVYVCVRVRMSGGGPGVGLLPQGDEGSWKEINMSRSV